MTSTLFIESAVAPVKNGNNWRAILITPGKGSSGVYSEDVLKEYGPQAFPRGTHSYVDHPVSEGEVRSPKNLLGVLVEDAHYEDGVGLVADLQIMPHWKDFVEAVAPHTGLSIYAMGDGERNDDGEVVVESLVPNVQNSVDLVSYAGRPGSGLAEKLYESALAKFKEAQPGELAEKDLVKWDAIDDRHAEGEATYGQVSYIMTSGVFPFEGDPLQIEATEENPVALIRVWEEEGGEWMPTQMLMGTPIAALTKISALGESKHRKRGYAMKAKTKSTRKEGSSNMDEIKAMLEEMSAAIEARFSALAETLSPSEEPEEKEEVDVAAVAEALVNADLPEVSRKAVYESLRNGGDLTQAIESQKVFVESVKSHLKESANAAFAEETIIPNTVAKAPSLRDILNVKVG